MTARQIALSATVLLQADDIEETIKTAIMNANVTALEADSRTLVRCIDLALSEIRGDGFPFVCEVEKASENGEITLPELGTALTVLKVARDGRSVPFEVRSSKIIVKTDGTYKISYSRTHSDITSLDGVIDVGAFVTTELVAYLAARNYCLVTGRTDEASVWDQMYSAESQKRRLTRRARLPRRAWR